MAKYAVIVQNDESDWDDVKGDLYHYPATYKSILVPGCKVLYFKGRLKKAVYAKERLSSEPHYFGVGIVGDSILDPSSRKRDRYCEILDYKEFAEAVHFKDRNGLYREEIPESKMSNYWRFGVREVSKSVFQGILSEANLLGYKPALPHPNGELESYVEMDGKKKSRFTSYYERIPFYRERAIEEHGTTCMVCEFDFSATYGEWGKGFIHVHHNKPVSETGPTRINPKTDLSTVCPNCHSMIHRRKKKTLTIEEARGLLVKKF